MSTHKESTDEHGGHQQFNSVRTHNAVAKTVPLFLYSSVSVLGFFSFSFPILIRQILIHVVGGQKSQGGKVPPRRRIGKM